MQESTEITTPEMIALGEPIEGLEHDTRDDLIIPRMSIVQPTYAQEGTQKDFRLNLTGEE